MWTGHRCAFILSAIAFFAGLARGEPSETVTVTGTVQDREGRPVAGATVWFHLEFIGGRVSAQSADDGSYELKGVHHESPFVFVEKEGFRLGGGVISEDGTARVVLTREGAPGEPMRRPAPSDETPRELLRSLIAGLPPETVESQSYLLASGIEALAVHDREFALTQIERVKSAWLRLKVLMDCGKIDEALAFTADNPEPQTYLLTYAASKMIDPSRKQALLVKAAEHARLNKMVAGRVRSLVDIADEYWKLGDRAAAQRIAEEVRLLASSMPFDKEGIEPRGVATHIVARFDPNAAWALVKDVRDEEDLSRLSALAGMTAFKIAASHPIESERFLGLMRDWHLWNAFGSPACYRMAPVDLPRALRIAEMIEEKAPEFERGSYHAQAYCSIALGISDRQPETARNLLRQAWSRLRPLGSDWQAAIALALHARKIDPDSEEEYFWRAAALHRGIARKGAPREEVEAILAQRVVMLAAFGQHPELQSKIMAPIFARMEATPGPYDREMTYDLKHVLAAAALVDAPRTIRWFHEHARRQTAAGHSVDNMNWVALREILSSERDERGWAVCENVYHLWLPSRIKVE